MGCSSAPPPIARGCSAAGKPCGRANSGGRDNTTSSGCELPSEALRAPVTCSVRWSAPFRGSGDEGEMPVARLSLVLLSESGKCIAEICSDDDGGSVDAMGLSFTTPTAGRTAVHISSLADFQQDV